MNSLTQLIGQAIKQHLILCFRAIIIQKMNVLVEIITHALRNSHGIPNIPKLNPINTMIHMYDLHICSLEVQYVIKGNIALLDGVSYANLNIKERGLGNKF
ncbi:hypothetical protein ACJX0J_028591 [Zea mays]